MEHSSTRSEDRHARHGGLLYPLLLVTAIAVIVFSVIGIATMTGVIPGVPLANDAAVRKHEPAGNSGPRRTEPIRQEPGSDGASPRSANRAEAHRACAECAAITTAPIAQDS